MNVKRLIKTIIICTLAVLLLFSVFITVTNLLVLASTSSDITSLEDFSATRQYDYILVLGAGIRNGVPSPALQDRLDTAISLYKSGACSKLLMSGDRQSDDYDEVGAMQRYAISKGVPNADIELDHAGYSTYESVYRAKYIYGADSILVVTQKYHLHRAVYIAESLGIDADGVDSDMREYRNQIVYDIREIFARTKDFFKCVLKPEVK